MYRFAYITILLLYLEKLLHQIDIGLAEKLLNLSGYLT